MNDEMSEAYDGTTGPYSTRVKPSGVRIIKPNRSIVVEPAVVAYILFAYPMGFVSSLYILDKISIDLARKEGMVNITQNDNDTDNLCTANKSDPVYIFQEEVQSHSAYFNILLTVAANVPAFFVSLFLGSYSDRVGRKFALVLPLSGTFCCAICYVIVIVLDLDINYLFIGSILNGFGGSFMCMLMGAFAYVADITEPEQRMFRITVIEMCMIASIMMTPIGMGYLIKVSGYLYPFLIVGVGVLLDILYVIFLVPETIQKDPLGDNRFFNMRPIKETVLLFTRDNGTNRRWQLATLMIAFLITTLPNMDYSLSTMFEKNEPLCWDAVMISYYTVVYTGSASLGGVISAKLLKCCLPDHAIALVACIGAVTLNVYRAFVQNTIMMFFSAAFGVLSILLIPTVRALMSKLVSESEQGAVFGAIASVEIICNLFGTLVFNAIYANTLYIASGFVYIVMACFYFAGGIIFVIYLCALYREKKAQKFSQLLIQDQDADNYDDCNPLIN